MVYVYNNNNNIPCNDYVGGYWIWALDVFSC